MISNTRLLTLASLVSLAACGTKTPLILPQGPSRPPLLGVPSTAPPAAAALKPPPLAAPTDNSASAQPR